MKTTNAVSDGDKTLRIFTKLNPRFNTFPSLKIIWQPKKGSVFGKHILLNKLLK